MWRENRSRRLRGWISARFDRGVAVFTLGATVIGVLVAFFAVYVAVAIPQRLDESARDRATLQVCTDSIFTMRDRLIALRRGYTVGPYDKLNRLADWDAVGSSLDQVPFTCERAMGAHDKEGANFEDLKLVAVAEKDSAYRGTWEETNTIALVGWTDTAIKAFSQHGP